MSWPGWAGCPSRLSPQRAPPTTCSSSTPIRARLDLNRFPPEAEEIEALGQGAAKRRRAAEAAVPGGLEAAVVAYGHLHIPSVRPWGDQHWSMSVRSVCPATATAGQYALDWRWRDGHWSARHTRLS